MVRFDLTLGEEDVEARVTGMEELAAWTERTQHRLLLQVRPTKADGLELIEEERRRQIEDFGFTTEFDQRHSDGELAGAAMVFLNRDLESWPWQGTPMFNGRIQDLVRAGALIAAELDRLLILGDKS